ncbi:MAG: heparan-alpha-glucosaminide N-acetyltransferase [Candidatus Micrarchaeota archaeon]
MGNRFWEIDSLRGVAVVAMIVFHLTFDLAYFDIYPVKMDGGFWWLFARVTASAFVFLAGLALTLSYARASKKLSGVQLAAKYFGRGAFVFCLGLLLTAFTFVFMNSGVIWFGILHEIGIATILGYLLLRYGNPRLTLLLSIVIIAAGLYLSTLRFDFSWLFWLGFVPQNLVSFDYVPLLPWFGVFALGMVVGSWLYPDGSRSFKLPELGNALPIRILCFLGSNSLLIYFLHQPILIATLYLLFPGIHLFF